MQTECEARHDAEIASSAADGPKEVGVLIVARCQQAAVCDDDFDGLEIVDAQAMRAPQPSNSARQSQSADPCL